MSKKQLYSLFIINMVIAANGNAIVGLMPVYLKRLGADSTATGYFLSAAFLSLAFGTLISGWLSNRFQRRTLMIVCGFVHVPTGWLLAQTTHIELLAVLTMVSAFLAGIQITTSGILTGLFAGEAERGRVFGIIGLGGGLGPLVAGFASGPIVDRWGFPTLFVATTVLTMVQPLCSLLLEDRSVPRSEQTNQYSKSALRNPLFALVFCASILAFIAQNGSGLVRPLKMDFLGFDTTAISNTIAVGGLLSLPIPLVIGWLSDRLGRKSLIIVCYLANTVGLLLLFSATSIGSFWAAASLTNAMVSSMVLGSALVTDLIPRDMLGTALSLFNATPWIGAVIGSSLTGSAMQHFGIETALVVAVALSLVAIALLVPLRPSVRAMTA